MKTRGFTILEILAVITLIMIIIAIAIPRFKGMQDEAKVMKVKGELKAIKAALESYKINHRVFPPTTDTITAQLKDAFPQIVDNVLYDPFTTPAHEYLYSATTDGMDYMLSSIGPDGVNGTAGILSSASAPSSGDDLVVTSGTVTALDTNTDVNNCGAIGTVCAGGQSCTNGACVAPAYTVTFDSQSATVNANPTSQTVTSPATTVGTLPTAPTRTGYTFGGWYTAINGGGTAFTASTAVSGSITVYAKWTDVCAGTPAIGTVCVDGTVFAGAGYRTTPSDAPGTYLWQAAMDYCASLGSGWVLPTKDELRNVLWAHSNCRGANYLCNDPDQLTGFTYSAHWSSTENGVVNAWFVYFSYGDAHEYGVKTADADLVRCIRRD